jgi:hypothetical protein
MKTSKAKTLDRRACHCDRDGVLTELLSVGLGSRVIPIWYYAAVTSHSMLLATCVHYPQGLKIHVRRLNSLKTTMILTLSLFR